MDTDDDVLLDLMESVTVDVLNRLGDDPEARYQFFKRFVELAKETVGGGCQRSADGSPN